jgi:hypothetical protein
MHECLAAVNRWILRLGEAKFTQQRFVLIECPKRLSKKA